MKDRVNQELTQARSDKDGGDPMVRMDGVIQARSLFDAFRTAFLLCPRRALVSGDEIDDDVRKMVGFWKEMAAEGGAIRAVAVKFQQ